MPNILLHSGKAFEIPKDFSRKVLCVGVWGGSPNIQYTLKKHGDAVLFNLSKNVGTDVPNLALRDF